MTISIGGGISIIIKARIRSRVPDAVLNSEEAPFSNKSLIMEVCPSSAAINRVKARVKDRVKRARRNRTL